jgi:hypothetical protein
MAMNIEKFYSTVLTSIQSIFVGFTLICISIGSVFLFISALSFMMTFQSILLSILILVVFVASYIIGRKIIGNFDEGDLK